MSVEEVERIMDETQDAIEYQRVSLHINVRNTEKCISFYLPFYFDDVLQTDFKKRMLWCSFRETSFQLKYLAH